MPASSAIRVFISYRRDDAGANAGRLFDWLVRQFGRANVFLDTDKIAHGDDFAEVLRTRLNASDVVLVVIGRQWLDIANAAGRRLDQPGDFVRMEVATALELSAQQGTRVIPVLVDGAAMPAAAELPAPLQRLAALDAATLRDAGFEQEFDRLVDDMLGRPRGYVRTELDRLQRLVKAIRVSSLLVPAVAVAAVFALWLGLLDRFTLDAQTASYLLWAGERIAPAPQDSGVLLISLDETSEARLGRDFGPAPEWRRDHARLIQRAAAAGARAIVFDLFFERPTTADEELAEAARNARGGPDGTRVVFGFRALDEGRPRTVPLLRDAADWGSVCIGRRIGYTYSAPLAILDPEDPGEPRQAARTPGLALVATLGRKALAVDLPRRELHGRDRDTKSAPRFSLLRRIDADTTGCPALARADVAAMLMIRFPHAGYWEDPVRRVSYADALDPGQLPDSRLHDRIVLVGITLPRAGDRYQLTGGLSSRSLYGVELHATAIENLVNGREVVTPTVDLGAAIALVMAAAGALVGYLGGGLGRNPRRLLLTGVALGYLAIAVMLASRGLLLFVLYDATAFLIPYLVLRRLRSGGFEGARPR